MSCKGDQIHDWHLSTWLQPLYPSLERIPMQGPRLMGLCGGAMIILTD